MTFLDALSQWAPRHSVTAYDSVAAGSTGLPWPDLNDAGAVSLLQTLRTAAGPRTIAEPALSIALPVPGDVRGLPAGTTFARDAVATGEALVVTSERGTPIGLVPDFEYDDSDDDYAEPGLRAASRPVRAVVDGVLAARPLPCPNTSTSVTPSSPCAPRCARPPTRWAGCVPAEPVWTSTIRAA